MFALFSFLKINEYGKKIIMCYYIYAYYSMKLADKKCVPCEVKIPPMKEDEIQKHLSYLSLAWKAVDSRKIACEFKLKNFKEAIRFVNDIAEVAELEGHHPDIFISYNKVRIELLTHCINGLSENDFILAAKIENLFKKLKK